MRREELEALFLENLPAIEKILALLSRRQGMSREVAEEFASWAKLRLIENDYAILGKFRGEAKITTYLNVVLAMLLREYRVQELGRWRNSAEAKRSGDLGMRLETLVHRDGLSIGEAGERLRTAGQTTLSDAKLAELVQKFPQRSPLRPVSSGELPATAASSDRADVRVDTEEQEAETAAANRALDEALASLGDEDRLIVRLHYLQSMTVAQIARALCLDQKPLYRRLERDLATLRAHLERAGVSADRVRNLTVDPQ